jgi:hypothetical protein
MKLKNISAILTLMASVIIMPSAHALLTLEISSGGTSTTITDDSIADFASANQDIISAPLVSVNGWSVFATAVSNSYQNANTDLLDLSSLSISGGAGSLTIRLTSTGYSKDGSNVDYTSGISGSTNGSVSFQSYLDTGNADFGEEILLADCSTLTGFVFSCEENGIVQTSSLYSLTTVATITHSNTGDLTRFDLGIKVPEPMTLALLGTGLLMIGFAGKNKRNI